MIHLENIVKYYFTDELQTTALDHLDLRIEQGEFLAIMGPSGCGKSTLLNIIGMLDRPDAGSYHFNGETVNGHGQSQLAELRKKNVGFVFQNFNLIEELSVRENIELPLLYQRMEKAKARARAKEVMERLNIDHRGNHYPSQLSGGQQQRVALARALAVEPKIILADEPTGNLDSKNGDEVMQIFGELHAQGATIVMVTHSSHDASFSSRAIHMLDGRIQPEKTTV